MIGVNIKTSNLPLLPPFQNGEKHPSLKITNYIRFGGGIVMIYKFIQNISRRGGTFQMYVSRSDK